jgi:hypothetical protein
MQWLDDAADLSRLCRTSKVLNYMALPQLYKEITLTRSFPSNEKLTTASPFLTALNTLASGNVGPLVKNLVLQDDYNLVVQYRIWRLSNPQIPYLARLSRPSQITCRRGGGAMYEPAVIHLGSSHGDQTYCLSRSGTIATSSVTTYLLLGVRCEARPFRGPAASEAEGVDDKELYDADVLARFQRRLAACDRARGVELAI